MSSSILSPKTQKHKIIGKTQTARALFLLVELKALGRMLDRVEGKAELTRQGVRK